MFLVNSCLGLFTAASFEAPLLPKLRGQFAEFLNNPSPVGLKMCIRDRDAVGHLQYLIEVCADQQDPYTALTGSDHLLVNKAGRADIQAADVYKRQAS